MNIFKKLFKKSFNDDFKSCIDRSICHNGIIEMSGWVFNKKYAYDTAVVVVSCFSEREEIPIKLIERNDVVHHYSLAHVKNCGFDFILKYKACEDINVCIELRHKNGTDRLPLITAPKNSLNVNEFYISRLNNGLCEYKKFKAKYVSNGADIPNDIFKNEIDIIVPVYNGFDFLENLFKTIEKTKIPHRIIVINDHSSDERVLPFLVKHIKQNPHITFINNEENLGFVQSVNKALVLSDKDVVLVNTDVILPEGWLERLILPIYKDRKIASVTPFTNSGTICSFPVFCENNEIFMGLDVDEVDAVFKKFVPSHTVVPTGVGFCMAMNRQAIDDIGILNAEVFYKGYGEENDWCQRAIKKGYKNVHVENLFVYHKHGASFPSEDKKRYIERNLVLLNQMHPNYGADVEKYCKSDPVRVYREYAKYKITSALSEKNIIVFDHNWGGGANSYSKMRIKDELSKGYGVLKIINDTNKGLYAVYIYKDSEAGFTFKNFAELDDFMADMNFESIIINEVISFDDVYPVLDYIIGLKEKYKARLVMLGHDYYSICPSIYLVDNENRHCFKPKKEKCEQCIAENKNRFNNSYGSMSKWRSKWESFLQECDEITLFSQNTESYFKYWYPELKNIKIVPHKVDYIKPLESYPTSKKEVNVGVLGNFMQTKGADVVLEMQKIIEEENLPMKITIIGENLTGLDTGKMNITGRYSLEELPEILKKNKIDIIFIASVWPETFSYTTEEAIKMGIYAACFDVGAQAERISKYKKGLVISKISPRAALDEIIEFFQDKKKFSTLKD